MPGTPLDPDRFDELQDTMGEDFVADLVTTFLEEAPGMLAALDAAHAGQDAEAYRRAAHSLKSNAEVFGATALAARARAIELEGLGADSAEQVAALKTRYAETAQALMAWRDG